MESHDNDKKKFIISRNTCKKLAEHRLRTNVLDYIQKYQSIRSQELLLFRVIQRNPTSSSLHLQRCNDYVRDTKQRGYVECRMIVVLAKWFFQGHDRDHLPGSLFSPTRKLDKAWRGRLRWRRRRRSRSHRI